MSGGRKRRRAPLRRGKPHLPFCAICGKAVRDGKAFYNLLGSPVHAGCYKKAKGD